VKTIVDDTLRLEVSQYRLCFTCSRCVHFDETTRSCAEGYPNGPHVDEGGLSRETLEFCKSFELA
jgi:hypothetical protein